MSSHASNHDKSIDPGQALNMERKKAKVLKEALKKERKERAVLEKDFERANEQIKALNTQLQDKVSEKTNVQIILFVNRCQEKRYFDLYQEKMLLEETLIRENATQKLQNRTSVVSNKTNTLTAPPVTFANPVNTNRSTLVGDRNSQNI